MDITVDGMVVRVFPPLAFEMVLYSSYRNGGAALDAQSTVGGLDPTNKPRYLQTFFLDLGHTHVAAVVVGGDHDDADNSHNSWS